MMSSEEKIRIIENWGRTVEVKRSPTGGCYMSCAVRGAHIPMVSCPMYDSYDNAIDKAYHQIYWRILDTMISMEYVEQNYTAGAIWMHP